MPERPWFKFFPSDWRAEDRLKDVSLAARGLWIEMLLLMDTSSRRGFLGRQDGSPLTDADVANKIGVSVEEVTRCSQELKNAGVFSVENRRFIYSRKMVRDSRLAESKAIGGRAKAEKHKNAHAYAGANAPAPSAYASASSSESLTKSEDVPAQPPRPVRARPPGTNIPPTLAECVEYGASIGMSAEAAEYCWQWWESAGWRRKGGPVKNWQRTMDVWSKSPFGNAVNNRGNGSVGKKPTPQWLLDRLAADEVNHDGK